LDTGLDDEGVEALLEATHRDLNARTPGTLPPLPPGFRLPAPAVPSSAAADVPTEVDAIPPTSTSDTSAYVYPPQPPPSALSRPERVSETEAAAAAAAAAPREVDRSAPAYELLVTVWGQPQRLVLYEGEVRATYERLFRSVVFRQLLCPIQRSDQLGIWPSCELWTG